MSALFQKSLPVVTRLPDVNRPPLAASANAPLAASATAPPATSATAPPPPAPPVPTKPPELPVDEIVRRALEAGDALVARVRLAHELALRLGADRVVLGWRRLGRGSWQTLVSGQGPVESRSELGRAYAAACAETALCGEIRQWDGHVQPPSAVPLSYRQLASLTGTKVVTGLPLMGRDREARSVILILSSSKTEQLTGLTSEGTERLSTIAAFVELCDAATPPPILHLYHWLRQAIRTRRRATLLGMALLLAAGLLPLKDHVSCRATLEPSVRRYIAAPFDGKLEKAVVKIGDHVQAGQTLALFDRAPLEIELSAQQSELEEAAKRRDSARAKGQAAPAQLADLEVAQIQSKVAQLERQLGELTVTSPIDGVVVHGQLQRIEGAPLARGQNLFEIAPLSPLIAELSIPEQEVRLVKAGQAATVWPAALDKSLSGQIERIHPRAEVRDGQTVFVAEVTLANEGGDLRPGMQARGVVYGSRQPLAWTLLRRPLARLARWTFW